MAASRATLPAASTKRRRSAIWSDRSRERAHRLDAELLVEARRNTDVASTDVAFLFELAQEIASTRGGELARAYRSLVATMAGFKNTRASEQRPADESARPCVVFVVRRKRSLDTGHPQKLPEWLVTYADRDGRRLPFALVTDVQDAAEHRELRAHANSQLWTERPGFERAYGHFAALVQITGDLSTYILSAMHVLSPDLDATTPAPLLLDVLPVDASGQPLHAPRLAVGASFGGLLVPDPGNGAAVSLDVQMACLDPDQTEQWTAISPLRGLDPEHATATAPDDLAALAGLSNRFELLRANNNRFGSSTTTVELLLSAVPTDGDVSYDFASGQAQQESMVYQRGLLRFDATDPTAVPCPGDSGSAIVFRNAATGLVTLVAMHIAGDGKGASLAIPAWTLFDTSDWNYPPPGALTLVDPG